MPAIFGFQRRIEALRVFHHEEVAVARERDGVELRQRLLMRASFTGSPRSELIATMGTEMSLRGSEKSYSSNARSDGTATRGGDSDMS